MNVKKLSGTLILAIALCVVANSCKKTDNGVITDKLNHCESVLPYMDGLFISNFGANVNNQDASGSGYITFYSHGHNEVLIPSDGNLSKPRGMGIFKEHLFVCDVNSIVVYDLNDIAADPQVILFPAEDLVVNDLVINSAGTLFASVTNTGRIYILDISNPDNINAASLLPYIEVPGPNGLVLDETRLYIASSNPNGNFSEDNVLYIIDDVHHPELRHLTHTAGQYDGIALSDDGTRLYFSDWNGGRIGYLTFENGEITYMPQSKPFEGPADLTLHKGHLYVPDLLQSEVREVKL